MILAGCSSRNAGGTPASPTSLAQSYPTLAPPQLNTGSAPWPAPVASAYWISVAGLPALRGEELEYHIHAHLDVFVNGIRQTVPAFIGIDRQEQVISPLHTHDASGLIHVEDAKPTEYFLGQFFTEWGVRLDARCVGGYCQPDTPIAVYVDGEYYHGDPNGIQITAHEEIAIVIGTPPTAIPDHYEFPPDN